MSDKETIEMIDSAVHRLAEHFDAVQILVSRMDQGNTQIIKRGAGNWYARRGMAADLIQTDLANETAEKVIEKLNQDGGMPCH